MNLLFSLITCFSRLSGLPAVWLGRKTRGMLWYYAWASLLADLYGFVASEVFHWRLNRLQLIIFSVAELLLVGAYYNQQLFPKRWRKAVFAGAIILAVWLVFDTAKKGFDKAQWEARAILNVPLILCCIAALFKVIRNIEYAKIERSPLFIFSAAFLLYAAYSELLMLFAEHFRSAPVALRQELWSVHDFLNAIKNLAIAYVFMLQAKINKAEAARLAPVQSFTGS